MVVFFTVIIPNMDYTTTFFAQIKKPYDALRFLNFAFCVARSNKSPVVILYFIVKFITLVSLTTFVPLHLCHQLCSKKLWFDSE